MQPFLVQLARGYMLLIRGSLVAQSLFLLLIRLYWGWGFFTSGKGKLMNLGATAKTFAGWDIPLPMFNAVMAGLTEAVCGLLLLVGLASRVVAVPLIFTMIVAYATAHREDVTSLYDFVTQPPFNYMMASLLVLLFGPGALSVDRAMRGHMGLPEGSCLCCGPATKEPASSGLQMTQPMEGAA